MNDGGIGTGLFGGLILLVIFILGYGVGCSFEQADWTKDCVHLGKHRNGNEVYDCTKEEAK